MTPDDYAPKRPLRVIDQHPIDDRIAEPPAEPTDTEYVALSIDRLRYLDLKKIAADMIGDAKPATPAEWADLMAEWAAANKTKATL